MNLDKFLEEVVRSLINTKNSLQKEFKRKISFNYKNNECIKFDIAVTAEKESSKSGEGGIQVLNIGGKGKITTENKNSTISRIQFGLIINEKTFSEEEEYLEKHKIRQKQNGY